jgi:hypothetical protein
MLEAFLIKNKISVRNAAKALKLGMNHLTRIMICRSRPDAEIRGRISFYTRGFVPNYAWGSPATKDALPLELCPPKTRGECEDGERPCPYLGCRYHLWNDIKLKHMPESLPEETCALDVAEEGEHTLLDISFLLLLTRERVRQVEHIATNKMLRRLTLLKGD